VPRLALAVVLTCLLSAAPAGAATVAVDDAAGTDGPGCGVTPQPACKTVQAGVTTAVDGDTVQIAAGTYTERVAVTEDLALDGVGATTIVRSPLTPPVGEDAVLDVAAAAVTVSDLRVESSGSAAAILARGGATLLVDRVEVVGAGDGNATGVAQDGVVFRGGASGVVRDATISGNDCGTVGLAACTADPATDAAATGAAAVVAYGSGASGVTVVGSTLVGNRYGVRAAGAPRVDVLDSAISGAGDAGIGVAVLDCDAACSGAGVLAQATQGGVYGSTISQTTRGVVVRDLTSDGLRPAPVLHADRIAGNGTSGATSDVPVDASGVWWGCNAGPGAAGCDTVGGQIDAGHHLVLRLHAAASSIATGGASTQLTADLTRDADGTARGAAFPDGTAVAFASALGSVSPSTAATAAGTAGATLSSGDAPGEAAPTATLDGQTVGAALMFTAPVPPQTVTQVVTVAAPTTPTGPTGPAGPTTPPDGAQLLASAREAIGRRVVRLGLTLTPGTAYVDSAIRTGKGTLTIADKDVVSLLVLSCPQEACDAGVSARVARVSKAGRKLKEYGLRRAEFSLEAGRMRVVAVRLTKAQRDGIRRVRSATMTVVIAVSDPAGNRNKRTLRLTVKVKRAATSR